MSFDLSQTMASMHVGPMSYTTSYRCVAPKQIRETSWIFTLLRVLVRDIEPKNSPSKPSVQNLLNILGKYVHMDIIMRHAPCTLVQDRCRATSQMSHDICEVALLAAELAASLAICVLQISPDLLWAVLTRVRGSRGDFEWLKTLL